MSEFFESFFNATFKSKPKKMKFHFSTSKSNWTFHIIPSVHFYFDSHSPFSHDRFWKDGISGLYLSAQWGKWLMTTGIYKKF